MRKFSFKIGEEYKIYNFVQWYMLVRDRLIKENEYIRKMFRDNYVSFLV